MGAWWGVIVVAGLIGAAIMVHALRASYRRGFADAMDLVARRKAAEQRYVGDRRDRHR